MKREIKFRVWNNKAKQMLSSNDIAIMQTLNGKIYKLDVMGSNKESLSYFQNNDVSNDYDLMQFTGLRDRDGKEIYEGDIIDHFALFGYLIFENGMFSISSSANTQFCNCKQPLAYHNVKNMKVIGNIHQNPELLIKSKAQKI